MVDHATNLLWSRTDTSKHAKLADTFRDRNIEIYLYDMSYTDGQLVYEVDNNRHADIFYFTNYFGYQNTIPKDIIKSFKRKGSTIIYDRTHSLFQEDKLYVDLADYSFASIRKWLGVPCGAYVSKKDESLVLPILNDYPYLSEKIEAMRQKADYIHGDAQVHKQSFLDLYNSFGHHLAECYRDFKIDDLSLFIWEHTDKDRLKSCRQANSTYLQDRLMEIPQIQVMFQASQNDCSLFVPILFETEEERNRVRTYLTRHSIYCPIHWPKPSVVKESLHVNDLYRQELSLICDQRYSIDDMSHIVKTLEEALATN